MSNDLFKDIESYLKNPTQENNGEGLLTGDEIQTLIMSLALHRKDEGFSEDEVLALVRWAERQKIGEGLLGLVLKGLAWVDDESGKFQDDSVVIGLTDLGESLKLQ